MGLLLLQAGVRKSPGWPTEEGVALGAFNISRTTDSRATLSEQSSHSLVRLLCRGWISHGATRLAAGLGNKLSLSTAPRHGHCGASNGRACPAPTDNRANVPPARWPWAAEPRSRTAAWREAAHFLSTQKHLTRRIRFSQLKWLKSSQMPLGSTWLVLLLAH